MGEADGSRMQMAVDGRKKGRVSSVKEGCIYSGGEGGDSEALQRSWQKSSGGTLGGDWLN